MERLTKKFTDGGAYCEEIEDVCIKSINSKTYVGKAVDKLAEYEDLEEKGMLLKLPCKVGDTVYRPVPNLYRTYTESVVKEINITDGGIYFKTDKGISWKIDKIGKTVFLTRQEAEQVLKKMESEE